MRTFARLYAALDETNKTSEKVDALADYFRSAPPGDAAWALALLTGRRPRRPVKTPLLAAWATERADLPAWLFQECYDAVGDLAETIARILPPPMSSDDAGLAQWIEERIVTLAGLPEEEQRRRMLDAWDRLDATERLVMNKLITGSFRVGVSDELVIRAVARVADLPAAVIAHRLTGQWVPSAEFFQRLLAPASQDEDPSKPYPFCLAHPLEADLESLGEIDDWQIEWKWDGIRSQLIRREGQVFLWSRGEELVTERYPEVAEMARLLPDGVALDGELLAWGEDRPLAFQALQARIGRKTPSRKLLAEAPVVFMAYDLLEWDGHDVRERSLIWRRSTLERLATGQLLTLRLSPVVEAASWVDVSQLRGESRSRGVEGFMLKRKDSPYLVGRKRGFWWKWKIEPYAVDAVLVTAQRGSGKRASLYTDYTFAVWHEGALVPFAKAYSGLTDAEIREVDAFVRRNTQEKFGPVRSVTPELVFELAFEGIQLSKRHKSGVAVRFPRIARWRRDKRPEEADSLESVRRLLG